MAFKLAERRRKADAAAAELAEQEEWAAADEPATAVDSGPAAVVPAEEAGPAADAPIEFHPVEALKVTELSHSSAAAAASLSPPPSALEVCAD